MIHRINGKDVTRAELSVRHLQVEFGGMRTTAIDTPKIRAYTRRRLEEGAANATVNRELAALKRMLIMAARCTPPQVNKVPFIFILKENNTHKGFLEHWEFEAISGEQP